MDNVAIGTVVFSRVNKIENLLESAEHVDIKSFWVADNGEITDEKKRVYSKDYNFNLNVIDVEYDSGLAHSRSKLLEKIDQEYILLVDSDMIVPKNVSSLYDILNKDQNIGGVCGMIIENGRIYSGCNDLHVEGSKCIKQIRDKKEIHKINSKPFIKFDQISNVAMFRQSCLEEQSWDPEYKIGKEHVDFALSHKYSTDWVFGLCPEVLFWHYPGGTESYQQKRSRTEASTEYFMSKWGFEETEFKFSKYIDTYDPRFNGFPPHSKYKWAKYYYQHEGLSSLIYNMYEYFKSILPPNKPY